MMPSARDSQPRMLVLGIGNPILSDDSVGLHVALKVEKEISGLDVKTASLAGLDILDLIVDYDVVIIIDAICAGGRVGEVRRLTLEDLPRVSGISSHDMGLMEAIDAGRILLNERMPKKIILYTVEVEEVSIFSEKLSSKVEAAVPQAVNLIKSEIEKILSNSENATATIGQNTF